jgi:hypothetical protein
VKTVGAAGIRALQGAATTGYEVEKVSQALEDVSAERAEFFVLQWRGRVALSSVACEWLLSTPEHVQGRSHHSASGDVRFFFFFFYSTRLLQLPLTAVYTSWKASRDINRGGFTMCL